MNRTPTTVQMSCTVIIALSGEGRVKKESKTLYPFKNFSPLKKRSLVSGNQLTSYTSNFRARHFESSFDNLFCFPNCPNYEDLRYISFFSSFFLFLRHVVYLPHFLRCMGLIHQTRTGVINVAPTKFFAAYGI